MQMGSIALDRMRMKGTKLNSDRKIVFVKSSNLESARL